MSVSGGKTMHRASSGVWDALHSKHGSVFIETVMDEDAWELHRRAGLRHRPRPWELVRVVLGYAGVLFWVALFSAAVGVYDITLVRRYGWPMLTIQCVQTFFGAITFALTLLLVFKTNASYTRWSDARRALGMLTSTAHNLARQAAAFFPPHQAHLTAAMLRWSAASMWAVKALVRPKEGQALREELKGVLLPCELNWLVAQPHKPLAVGQALSVILQAVDLDAQTKTSVDKTLSTYVYEFGGCNRIYNTAIPSAYTRHTSRFLLCYILCGLPLLMWPLAGWGAPLLSVAIAFLVLGIEQISAYVEEPFKVLAFDAFCQAVTRDMQTVMAMVVTTPSSTLGRPPLSRDSLTPQAPVIAGLNGPLVAEAAAVPTTHDSSSSHIAHQNPFWGFDKHAGSSTSSLGAAHVTGSAAAQAGAGMCAGMARPAGPPVAPAGAATGPLPMVLSIDAHQMGQLPFGPGTPAPLMATSPNEVQIPSVWGGFQERQSRVVDGRRSFDVGSGGRQRRPVQAVNSRTSLLPVSSRSNLLSMAAGSSAAL